MFGFWANLLFETTNGSFQTLSLLSPVKPAQPFVRYQNYYSVYFGRMGGGVGLGGLMAGSFLSTIAGTVIGSMIAQPLSGNQHLKKLRGDVDFAQPHSTNGQIPDLEHAMKYLCLAYEAEEPFNAMSRSEWDALRKETLAYVEALQQSGHLILTNALQSARTAATLRVRNGKLSVTDGPFAETKEQLGGFFLINARDMNEAIQVASKWPSARLGNIEVRPVEEALSVERRYS